MQRKRDELVPIGDAVSGLEGGPVQAIRDATPQARHHFTQADQVHQLVAASEADRPKLPPPSSTGVEEDQAGLAGVELHDGAGRLGPRPLTQNSYLQSAENPGGFVNQDQDIGLAKGTAMSNSLPNRVEPLERHQEILSILED